MYPLLYPTSQLIIKELHVSLGVSRALVLHNISIGLLQKERREPLYREALRLLGVLLGLHHLNIHLFSSDVDCAIAHELGEFTLGRCAVRAPVGVEHGEGGKRRGIRVLETLGALGPDLETAPDCETNNNRRSQYNDNDGK